MKPEFKTMSKRCPKCNKLVFINSLQQTETECPDCRTQFKIIHLLRRGVKLVERGDA
jgi:phage FluMu protein Com